MLVRDVDGKTFWNALNDVISPRIKEQTAVDESALSNFRNTFQGRDLKQGTLILLTWIEPSKMLVRSRSIIRKRYIIMLFLCCYMWRLLFHLTSWKLTLWTRVAWVSVWTFWYLQVSISSDGFPTNVDAEIESVNVTLALFDGFFGVSPVSPTLKISVANGLVAVLNWVLMQVCFISLPKFLSLANSFLREYLLQFYSQT